MSTSTLYRGLEPLIAAGLIEDRRGHYTLPLSHPHNYAFKLWHDQAQLLELPPTLRTEVLAHVRELENGLGSNLLALWLHGSVAQLAMGEESDVDFLAVVRKDQELELRGTRPVQLTLQTEKVFRQGYRDGDSFLRTVLGHGLLLVDRGYAQEFYRQPFPPASPAALRGRQELQERLRSRVLFFLKEEALEDARAALSSLAVATGRLALEQLRLEPPAGKDDLVAQLRLYFGPQLAQLVLRCLSRDADLGTVFLLQRRLTDWLEHFALRAEHLRALLRDLSGSPQHYEAALQAMLSELAPGGLDQAVEGKSMKSTYTLRQLEALPPARPRFVVVNQLREIPWGERPSLGKVLDAAAAAGVGLVDVREVWGLYVSSVLADGVSGSAPSVEEFFRSRLPATTGKARKSTGRAKRSHQSV